MLNKWIFLRVFEEFRWQGDKLILTQNLGLINKKNYDFLKKLKNADSLVLDVVFYTNLNR